MNLKNKWAALAGSVVVAGSLAAAGVSFAASTTPTTAPPAAAQAATPDANGGLDKAVASGKLTQAQADVLKQVQALRKAAMDKVTTDAKALIDQAVKDGKLTQAQADQITQKGGKEGFGDWGGHEGGGKHGHGPMTQEAMKAKLDAEVKSGKITQAQADQMLQKFAQRQAEESKESTQTPQPKAPGQSN